MTRRRSRRLRILRNRTARDTWRQMRPAGVTAQMMRESWEVSL